jgi:hypothetical protein
MMDSDWHIGRLPHEWGEKALSRLDFCPEKFEVIDGELLLSEEERVNLLGALLELVGTDRAVQLGDATVWRKSVEVFL